MLPSYDSHRRSAAVGSGGASPGAAPPGARRAEPPPEAELLEYKSAAGAALVGRSLIFNWVGVGWCAGTIESAEKDGRHKSKARVA